MFFLRRRHRARLRSVPKNAHLLAPVRRQVVGRPPRRLRRLFGAASAARHGAGARAASCTSCVDVACRGRGRARALGPGTGIVCAVCGKPDAAVGARCRLLGYCGADHKGKDLSVHKQVCRKSEFGVVPVLSWEQRMLAEAAAAALVARRHGCASADSCVVCES